MRQTLHRGKHRSAVWPWPCIALAGSVLLLSPGRPAHAIALLPQADSQDRDEPARGRIPGGEMLRGTVSSVNGDRLSLTTEDDQKYDILTSSNTRIVRQRQPIKFAEIKPGDGVGAAGVLDASTHTLHALVLFDVSADEIRKAKENLGKTYITGRVTAINDLKLTIERPDHVAQTIEVDEGTSFRKGGKGPGRGFGVGAQGSGAAPSVSSPPSGAEAGESITLADLKVGDAIFATGTLHAGVFHPTELHVGSPRKHRLEGSAAVQPSTADPHP